MSEQLQNNKTITGGAGITAGNDVSIGDVTGQLAIGEYINQFMIKEPSGEALVELIGYLEQKRKEAVNLEILSSYNLSALPDYPPKLKEFVTRNRIEELNKALIYLQNHRILLFTGMGGAGKTTLARALVDIRPANVPAPFWFDFRQNEDVRFGDILEKLAAYMNCPDLAKFREEKREAGKKDIDKLTDKLQEGEPIWLIFDNLETILDDIFFRDEYMDLLFSNLRNNTHQAKIIITSRVSPKSRSGEYVVDVIEGEKQDVKGLKINFAVDYLVKNGLASIEPFQLEKLATGVDGHPLALKLLVGLVNDLGEEIVLEDLSIYQEEKHDTILKARKLFDKLVGDEKELLERISVYRESVELKGLKEMFTEKNSLNNIKKLMNKSLLETDHNGNFWLHPLVQEFAYEDLGNKVEAHKIAYNYYLSLSLPEVPTKKEEVQSLIEAHYHACIAKEYNEAFHIIFDNNLHEKLDLWGNYTVLIDLYSRTLPKDHFGNEILQKNKGDHGAILANLGLAYSYLGEQRKAIEYYEHALKILREIGDRHGESNCLGNLGLTYRYLGEQRKAIEYHEQAIKISREIGDTCGEGNLLGNLGSAYYVLGEPRKAIEYYEQALKISREIGDRRREGIQLGNLGNAHSDLGEQRKAIKYYEQAIKISREIGDRRGEGTHLGNLGLAYSYLGESRKAIEYYEQALKTSRDIEDRRREGTHLGNLGLACSYLGEPRKAIEYCEQALKISREVEYRRGEADQLGNLGTAYSDLGEPGKAIEYYEQALAIAKEIGNRLAEGAWLGNLGKAYRDLEEPKKAIEYCEQALKIFKEIGYRVGETEQLGNLGCAYHDLKDHTKAIEYCEQALKIAEEIEDRRGEADQLGNLGRAYYDLKEPKKAIDYHKQALNISKEIGYRRAEGNCLKSLAETYGILGESKKAIECCEQALSIGREIEDPRIINSCERNLEALKNSEK